MVAVATAGLMGRNELVVHEYHAECFFQTISFILMFEGREFFKEDPRLPAHLKDHRMYPILVAFKLEDPINV